MDVEIFQIDAGCHFQLELLLFLVLFITEIYRPSHGTFHILKHLCVDHEKIEFYRFRTSVHPTQQ